MNIMEYLIAYFPFFLILCVMVIIIRKTGAFQQRDHRKRVEQLLERIANAVEKSERN